MQFEDWDHVGECLFCSFCEFWAGRNAELLQRTMCAPLEEGLMQQLYTVTDIQGTAVASLQFLPAINWSKTPNSTNLKPWIWI